MPKKAGQKGRIPRTNAAIILICLLIIGAIITLHIAFGKQIGIDLYGFIVLLFVIVFGLLDYAGVKILKALRELRKALKGGEDGGKSN